MTCNRRLDFAAILTEILPLRDRGNCRNFAGSAVVARFALSEFFQFARMKRETIQFARFLINSLLTVRHYVQPAYFLLEIIPCQARVSWRSPKEPLRIPNAGYLTGR